MDRNDPNRSVKAVSMHVKVDLYDIVTSTFLGKASLKLESEQNLLELIIISGVKFVSRSESDKVVPSHISMKGLPIPSLETKSNAKYSQTRAGMDAWLKCLSVALRLE